MIPVIGQSELERMIRDLQRKLDLQIRNNDTGWITPTLTGSWVNYDAGGALGHQPARYRRLNGIVYIQGLIKNGTVGAACMNLPTGFRTVGGKLLFTATCDGGTGRADVDPNGNIVVVLGTNGWFSLELAYPAGA